MRLWSLQFAITLLLTGWVPCLGQQPSGPQTLEKLVRSDEGEDGPATDDDAADAEATSARPTGTLARPKDGAQHPELDKAWAEYDGAVAKAAEGISKAITNQFEAERKKGALELAEKWQAIGTAFKKSGALPKEKETEKQVKTATAAFTRASNSLKEAYEQVTRTLTMDGKLAEARAARDEWKSLAAGAVATLRPNEWATIFDGSTEEVWNHGWGEEAKVEKDALRLSGADSGLCYAKVVQGDLAFESQVQFQKWGADGMAKIGICCSEAGSYYLHLHANGGGDVGKWDHVAKQLHSMHMFQGPPLRRGGWHTLELQRDRGRLRGKLNGRQIFDLALPANALPDGDVQVGVWNADAIFKGMRLKLRSLPDATPDRVPKNQGVAAAPLKPEKLLAMCLDPVDADAKMTQIDELPVELRGMWWAYAKPDAAGRVELVPEDVRRFASFLITARSWQVANPAVETQPTKFRMMARLADVEGLPSYFLILSDELHWVVHGPVAGRWVLIRGFRELGQELDRKVFELMK